MDVREVVAVPMNTKAIIATAQITIIQTTVLTALTAAVLAETVVPAEITATVEMAATVETAATAEMAATTEMAATAEITAQNVKETKGIHMGAFYY